MTARAGEALVLITVSSLTLGGCGGVADAKSELNLRVSRHGRTLSGRSVSVAMRRHENVPLTKPQRETTGAVSVTDKIVLYHGKLRLCWTLPTPVVSVLDPDLCVEIIANEHFKHVV